MLQTFSRLRRIDAGFNPKNLLSMMLSLSPVKYSDGPKARAFFKRLEQRIATLPNVENAAFTTSVPLNGANVTSLLMDGESFTTYGDHRLTVNSSVGVGYFQTMNMPILKGRSFTEQETDKTPLVVVIDENMARDLFPDNDPVGQHIKVDEGTIRFEVIGVVGHIKHLSWDGDAQSKVKYQMYSNYNQIPEEWFARVTRTMSLVAH